MKEEIDLDYAFNLTSVGFNLGINFLGLDRYIPPMTHPSLFPVWLEHFLLDINLSSNITPFLKPKKP
jgi:hypothetical protein